MRNVVTHPKNLPNRMQKLKHSGQRLILAGSNAMPAFSYAPASNLAPKVSLSIPQSGLVSPSPIRGDGAGRHSSLSDSVTTCSGVCNLAHLHSRRPMPSPYQKTLCGGSYRGSWGTTPSLRRMHTPWITWIMSMTLRPRNNPSCSSSVESIIRECTITLEFLSGVLRVEFDRVKARWPIAGVSSGQIGTNRNSFTCC